MNRALLPSSQRRGVMRPDSFSPTPAILKQLHDKIPHQQVLRDEIALTPPWPAFDDLLRHGAVDPNGNNVGFRRRIDIDDAWFVDGFNRRARHLLHLSRERDGRQQSEHNNSNEIST